MTMNLCYVHFGEYTKSLQLSVFHNKRNQIQHEPKSSMKSNTSYETFSTINKICLEL